MSLAEIKLNFWQGIIVAIITAVGGFFTANYHFLQSKPEIEQGIQDINIEGKWKYICTSFDRSYQHGGRFLVQKDKILKQIQY